MLPLALGAKLLDFKQVFSKMKPDVSFVLRCHILLYLTVNTALTNQLFLHFDSRLVSISGEKCYHILLVQLVHVTLDNKANCRVI